MTSEITLSKYYSSFSVIKLYLLFSIFRALLLQKLKMDLLVLFEQLLVELNSLLRLNYVLFVGVITYVLTLVVYFFRKSLSVLLSSPFSSFNSISLITLVIGLLRFPLVRASLDFVVRERLVGLKGLLTAGIAVLSS